MKAICLHFFYTFFTKLFSNFKRQKTVSKFSFHYIISFYNTKIMCLLEEGGMQSLYNTPKNPILSLQKSEMRESIHRSLKVVAVLKSEIL